MIATHGSPSLKEPDMWSPSFKDFLKQSTEVEIDKRPTAIELLEVALFFSFLREEEKITEDVTFFVTMMQHPFLRCACPKERMATVIGKWKRSS